MSWNYDIKALADTRTAEVAIFGDIGESWFEETTTAKSFVKDLAAIDADEITIRINSHGGSVVDGLAIYNAIKRHPAKTISSVEGIAASIASYIAMAADTRRIAANAMFMVHGAWTLAVGNSKKLRETADILDLHSSSMAHGYAAASGKNADEIKAMLTDGEDHWFSADEAMAAGYFSETTEAVEAVASLDTSSRNRRTFAPVALIAAMAAAQPTKGTPTMVDKTAGTADPVAAQKIADDAAIRAEVLKQDTQRRSDIVAAFKPFASHTGVSAIMDAALIDTNCDVQAANSKLLAHLGAQGSPIVGASIHTVEDETDKRRTGIVAAMMIRAGVADADTRAKHAGNPFRGQSLFDIARASLARDGIKTDGMDRMAIVGAAFTQGTGDFPILLENVLHKTLQTAYAAQPDTWTRFCARGSVSDFRAHNRYRVGSIGNLETVNELGEFKSKPIPDGEKGTLTATTKGNIVNISRQAIINDDLGAMLGLATSLGRAAKRTVEADVYALLASNPVMSDGVALFHATHANLVATGAVPSVDQFDNMRVLMAQQKDVGGNDFLSLTPGVWLGPVGLGGTARVVNAAEYDPDATTGKNRPNKVRGLVGDIVDSPRLSGTAYYMFADPSVATVIEVAFLDGQSEPFLESQTGFTVDGTAWKVRLDYGVAAIDYRGAVKNNGA